MKKILICLVFLVMMTPAAFCGNDFSKKFFYSSDTSSLVSPAVVDAAQRGRALKKLAFGGNINVNFDNNWVKYNGEYNGNTDTKGGAFQVVLKPKLCWYLNEKMQLGGRVGFNFGNYNIGTKEHEKAAVTRALGWSINPYFSYRLIQWKRLGIWIEANAMVGQNYNVGSEILVNTEWNRMTEYAVQVLPNLEIYLAEGFSLELHFGILSLGWYGTTAHFEDRKEVTSSWDIRKGGLDGLFYGFANYGIGLVRRF